MTGSSRPGASKSEFPSKIPRFRVGLLTVAAALAFGLAWSCQRRPASPQLLFIAYTNSPEVLNRFVTLPADTRVAVFCLTNPGPARFLLRGDVIREARTNGAADFSRTVCRSYLSDGWLEPGGAEWIQFPEPSNAAEWRLSTPVVRPGPHWLLQQQKILRAVKLWDLVSNWQEWLPESDLLHPAGKTNLDKTAN